MSLIPTEIAKALKEARRLAFEANTRTNQYADRINNLANENDSGIVDIAALVDENSQAIMELAEMIGELTKE